MLRVRCERARETMEGDGGKMKEKIEKRKKRERGRRRRDNARITGSSCLGLIVVSLLFSTLLSLRRSRSSAEPSVLPVVLDKRVLFHTEMPRRHSSRINRAERGTEHSTNAASIHDRTSLCVVARDGYDRCILSLASTDRKTERKKRRRDRSLLELAYIYNLCHNLCAIIIDRIDQYRVIEYKISTNANTATLLAD